jgi:Na+-translocating ferredoxin:NAD+ oxidoreductase subunit G
MSTSMDPTLRATLLGGALLAACALLSALLLTGTERLTRERIAESRRQLELNALSLVLPPAQYDNDPLSDRISVIAPAWLGSKRPLEVRRARYDGLPAGLAIEAIAPDGYSGPIRLLVGVDGGGRVLGVRVIEHQETPGLGDAIEAERSDWIDRLRGRQLGEPPPARWTVRKHGGEFDQFSGATISPRAVVVAVRRVLQFVQAHGEALYAAPVDATVEHHDGPDARVARRL